MGSLGSKFSPEQQLSTKRTLAFVLDRPTPLHLETAQKHGLRLELSIIKQCLLFDKDDAPARVLVYKIA